MVTKSMLNQSPNGIVTSVPVIDKIKAPLKKQTPASSVAVVPPKASKGKAAVKKAPMGQCAYCKYDIYRHGSQHQVAGKKEWFHNGCWGPFQVHEAKVAEKAKATAKTL